MMCTYCSLTILLLTTLFKDAYTEANERCSLPEDLVKEIAGYSEKANRIIEETLKGQFKSNTYNELADFIDKFGARFAGSQSLEDSIDYMLDKLKTEGLENVHGEELEIPHWVRGEEEAALIKPRIQAIPILGLGGTIGTPADGIEAEVLVVTSFEELRNISRLEVEGKIIVFVPRFASYQVTVRYRQRAASEAGALGAAATLVTSITPFSISTLHAGWQVYSPGIKKIPTATITVEDAHMLQRLQDRGDKILMQLKINSHMSQPVTSRNTIAELKGSKEQEQVVIVSGHLDSWDVGQGAMDDGGGAFISWNALVVLKRLGLRPARTIRSILWTAEEIGLVGANAYAKAHENETQNILVALESDEGTFRPTGLKYTASEFGGCILQEIVKLLAPINATKYEKLSSVGSDITALQYFGIPTISLKNENDKYFWFHHTAGDTMDVESSDDLDKNTALFAIVSYILADLSVDFPRDD